MHRRPTLLAAAVAVAALGLTGCGGDDDTATTTTEAASGGSTEQTTETTAGGAGGTEAGGDVLAEIEARGKPEVKVPDAPATELKVTDVVEGTGAAVQPTDSVTVHYVGVGQQSGKEFDSSWSRGETISFPLDGVIPGWSEGLVGMKVGGRRELVIPGAKAYGPNPPSPDIAPDETLVFVVDLAAIG